LSGNQTTVSRKDAKKGKAEGAKKAFIFAIMGATQYCCPFAPSRFPFFALLREIS
jgi:hypothetical protein